MIVQTFAQIEQAEGIHYDYDRTAAQYSSLTAWYDQVREKRFSDFSIGDWCRCVRQEQYLEYIIEWTLSELRKDPLAGEQYDGELANAFTSVNQAFWMNHEEEREAVKNILCSAYDQYEPDVQQNIDRMLGRWNEHCERNNCD